MEYQLKNDSIEAWQIGSEPVPEWVVGLLAEKVITDVGGTYSVSCINDRENANTGDYITFQPTVWGEPTDEFPQGEVLAVQEVQKFAKADFEALYDVPEPTPDEPEDDAPPSGATAEVEERQYR